MLLDYMFESQFLKYEYQTITSSDSTMHNNYKLNYACYIPTLSSDGASVVFVGSSLTFSSFVHSENRGRYRIVFKKSRGKDTVKKKRLQTKKRYVLFLFLVLYKIPLGQLARVVSLLWNVMKNSPRTSPRFTCKSFPFRSLRLNASGTKPKVSENQSTSLAWFLQA